MRIDAERHPLELVETCHAQSGTNKLWWVEPVHRDPSTSSLRLASPHTIRLGWASDPRHGWRPGSRIQGVRWQVDAVLLYRPAATTGYGPGFTAADPTSPRWVVVPGLLARPLLEVREDPEGMRAAFVKWGSCLDAKFSKLGSDASRAVKISEAGLDELVFLPPDGHPIRRPAPLAEAAAEAAGLLGDLETLEGLRFGKVLALPSAGWRQRDARTFLRHPAVADQIIAVPDAGPLMPEGFDRLAFMADATVGKPPVPSFHGLDLAIVRALERVMGDSRGKWPGLDDAIGNAQARFAREVLKVWKSVGVQRRERDLFDRRLAPTRITLPAAQGRTAAETENDEVDALAKRASKPTLVALKDKGQTTVQRYKPTFVPSTLELGLQVDASVLSEEGAAWRLLIEWIRQPACLETLRLLVGGDVEQLWFSCTESPTWEGFVRGRHREFVAGHAFPSKTKVAYRRALALCESEPSADGAVSVPFGGFAAKDDSSPLTRDAIWRIATTQLGKWPSGLHRLALYEPTSMLSGLILRLPTSVVPGAAGLEEACANGSVDRAASKGVPTAPSDDAGSSPASPSSAAVEGTLEFHFEIGQVVVAT